MEKSNTIIQLSDIIEQKLRKEKEIAYYQHQIAILSEKLHMTNKELSVTTIILDLIQNENVANFLDFKEKYKE